MSTIQQVIDTVEQLAPLNLQEHWDNSGVQVGFALENECTGVILTLDVTYQALEEALQKGANLIISHHPLLFTGVKSVTANSLSGRIIGEAILKGVVIYSSHTPMDSCQGGLNDYLASALELKDIEMLEPSGVDEAAGLGRVGMLPEIMTPEELALKLKELLGLSKINYSPQCNKISKVALCTGSGSSLLGRVEALGVDAYLTGDLKYSNYQNMEGRGLSLFDIGHYDSEICIIDILESVISKKFTTFATHKFRYSSIMTI